MKFGTLKSVLWAISLSGCAQLPEFPEVWQCQYNGTPRAFYCINTKTKDRMKLDALDTKMKGAQCLSPEDYKKSEDWVQLVKEIAERRCK